MKTLNRILIAIIAFFVLLVLPFSELYHELARAWHNFNYRESLKYSWKCTIKDAIRFFKLGKINESQSDVDARIKKEMSDL